MQAASLGASCCHVFNMAAFPATIPANCQGIWSKEHAPVGHALQHVQKKMRTDKTMADEVEQVARAIAA